MPWALAYALGFLFGKYYERQLYITRALEDRNIKRVLEEWS